MSFEQKYTKLTSPKGTLRYPKLATPDTYEGKTFYCTELILSEALALPLIGQLEKIMEDAHADEVAKAKTPVAKKKLEAYHAKPSWAKETDKEGNELENYIFKFKGNYQWKGKDGSVNTNTIRMFDAKGMPVKGVNPWGGTEAKIAFECLTYDNAAAQNYGVSLRLSAVQIIKLVTGNGGTDGSNFGFEAEDGFEAPEVDSFDAAAVYTTGDAAVAGNF